MMIKLQAEPIRIESIVDNVYCENSGAVNIFIGRVRSTNKNKSVVRLEYEAYDQMALKEMEKIVRAAKEKWPIDKFAVIHRKGKLAVGDIAVVIAVSTPHRKESFEACSYMIDQLKATVPVWKKEIYEDGEEWLSAQP